MRSTVAVASRARRKKIIKAAKGYRGRNKNVLRVAMEKVDKGLQYQYRDRRNKNVTSAHCGSSVSMLVLVSMA